MQLHVLQNLQEQSAWHKHMVCYCKALHRFCMWHLPLDCHAR